MYQTVDKSTFFKKEMSWINCFLFNPNMFDYTELKYLEFSNCMFISNIAFDWIINLPMKTERVQESRQTFHKQKYSNSQWSKGTKHYKDDHTSQILYLKCQSKSKQHTP